MQVVPGSAGGCSGAMSEKLSVDQKMELITRNLQEVVGQDDIRKVLEERDLKAMRLLNIYLYLYLYYPSLEAYPPESLLS